MLIGEGASDHTAANRGAAADALALAEAASRDGDVERALKFAKKSHRLHHNAEARSLIERLEIGSASPVYEPRLASRAPPAVRGGWLHKEGHYAKTWKRRWFVVADGAARYYRAEDARKMLGEMDLRGASQVECVEGDLKRLKGNKWGWVLRTAEIGRLELAVRGGVARPMHDRYLLAAESEEERSQWKRALGAHITYASAARISAIRPTVTVEGDGGGAPAPEASDPASASEAPKADEPPAKARKYCLLILIRVLCASRHDIALAVAARIHHR